MVWCGSILAAPLINTKMLYDMWFIQYLRVLKQTLVLTAAVARMRCTSDGFHILQPNQPVHGLAEPVERER